MAAQLAATLLRVTPVTALAGDGAPARFVPAEGDADPLASSPGARPKSSAASAEATLSSITTFMRSCAAWRAVSSSRSSNSDRSR